jgi:AcrR family transcriptional regulator
MARTKAADYEDQRDGILDAAAAVFAKDGFAASSMAMLGDACGASKARLYHYYASKEAILFDLLDRYTLHLISLAREAASGTAADRRLDAMVRAFMREYATSQTRHAVLLHDVNFLAGAQRLKIRAQELEIVSLFRSALDAAFPGRIPEHLLTAHTMMLFGMINWTFTWLKPGGRLSYADFAETVLGVLHGGIGGAHAAADAEPGLANAAP